MKMGMGMSIAVAMLLPTVALAGGSAVIQSGDASQQVQARIEFDGSARMRMDTLGEGAGQGYMILRDGKAYSVAMQGGNPVVVEMGSMMKMLGGMAKQPGMQQPMAAPENMAKFVSLTDTGRSESVAGISGKVHTLVYVDNAGQQHSETMVLSKDARARELTQALISMGETMAKMADLPAEAGSEQLAAEFKARGQGMLRYGDNFKLISLDSKSPAASRFELPAAPMQMPDLGGMMGGSASAEGGAGADVDLGAIFGQKAQRQQQRVEGRAEAEVDQATDSVVDKALNKAFDKLFGN